MQFHAEHPVKSRRIHDAALHRVGGINPWGAHVNLGFGVTRSWHYGKIGLRLDLPSGFRLEGLAQIHAYRELPDMLKVAVGMEQIAALIQQREAGEAINIEGLRTVIGLHILRPGDEILAVLDEVIHIEGQEAFGESGLGTGHAGCAGLIVHGAVIGHCASIRHIGTVGTDGHDAAPFT